MGELLSYSVTLNKNVVEKVQEIYLEYGGKLSPLINNLLKEWLKKKGGKK
jgi:hypothetical protein